MVGCGLVGWSRRRESLVGPLLAAAGLTWFIANFTAEAPAPVMTLASSAAFLYRGFVCHALLAYPGGRGLTRIAQAGIFAGYSAALVPAIWLSGSATAIAAALFGLTLVASYRSHGRRARRDRRPALVTGMAIATILGTSALVPTLMPGGGSMNFLQIQQAALILTSVLLLAGLLGILGGRPSVADMVVELGESRSGTLQETLAAALGDPSLEVGYWLPDLGRYVDAAGTRFDVPRPGGQRAVTVIGHDGPLAVLAHDPAVLDDPELKGAIAVAARLAASNARLQAETRAQLDELRASRRRLMEVGEVERIALERRLREGAERRLDTLAGVLTAALDRSRGQQGPAPARLERALDQLARTMTELRELARGLSPRRLEEAGMAAALRDLAEQCPVAVTLSIPHGILPRAVEATLYYVSAEALANVAKHSAASHARATVQWDSAHVRLEIVDDGIGGADLARGSGLRGLADRVEAIGGTLAIDSSADRGTCLAVEIPLDGEARQKGRGVLPI